MSVKYKHPKPPQQHKKKCAKRDCGMTAQGMYHCAYCCPLSPSIRPSHTLNAEDMAWLTATTNDPWPN